MSDSPQPPFSPLRMVVLISGGGTTLANLLQKIATRSLDAEISLVISSHPAAAGLEFAQQAGAAAVVIERSAYPCTAEFSRAIFDACRSVAPHVVAMGGFLKRLTIPSDFCNRVLNIHPALIPAFCGKGYYGQRVHEAVLQYGAKLSGCTVHFVDDQYDHGPIILQRAVPVLDDDTPLSLAQRVFAEECLAYPEALRRFATGKLCVAGRVVRTRM